MIFMPVTELAPGTERWHGLAPEALVAAFKTMYVSRRIDDKEIQLKRQNRIFFQISGAGHEAAQVALAAHLVPGKDWFFGYYRDRAICLALGMTPYEMFLDAVGAVDAPSSAGRQMPSHWSHPKLRIFTTSSPTGSECLPGVGAAEAGRFLARPESRSFLDTTSGFASDEVTVVTIGDGSTSEGEFWEALNYATTQKLPVLFVVEDNGYAISVPVEVNTPGGSISKLVRGYPGLFITETDGCDYLGSYDAFKYAVAYCRDRRGPALVHAHVTRPYSHSLSDDEKLYRPEAERREEAERDPIARMERFLVAEGVLTAEKVTTLKAEWDAEVNAASDAAALKPQPAAEDVLRHIYSEEVDPTSALFDTEDHPSFA
ncbi:MAG: thiamine pyrophosphate-dependent dehydrogenase E1 component subunit alpha, partial [Acidobacteria bacterium]|nr:thiamine pyrophosphate-dependent dehydrogenase E1 component subunit alpha [Acidobacteriota bacterium]